MLKLAAFSLALLLPLYSWAQEPVDLSDLGDLAVPWTRVRNASGTSLWWPPFREPDTSGHEVFTVTGCDLADNSNDDEACVDDDFASALASTDPDGAVLYFPAGTYNFPNNQMFEVERDNFVIRCENPNTTTLKFEAHNEGICAAGSDAFICFSGGGVSNTVSWTAGYEETDTVLTVSSTSGFAVGDYVLARMNSASGCYDNPGNSCFNHYAKIVCIDEESPCDNDEHLSTGQIEIDRGLRMDYDDNSSCGSKYLDKVEMVENVGFENCHLTHTLPGCTPGQACGSFDYQPGVAFDRAAHGWATGNKFEKWSSIIVVAKESRAILIEGNSFIDIKYQNNSNSQGVGQQRTTDTWIVNNIFEANRVAAECEKGAEGSVFAHNFHTRDWPPVVSERSMFLHGKYCRETLIESNDLDASPQPDNHWGRQGPRNIWYRNRQRSTMAGDNVNCTGAGGNHCLPSVFLNLEADSQLVADKMSYIANINRWMMSGTPFTTRVPDRLPASADFDKAQTNMHLEYNVSPGFNLLTAEPTTNCGDGVGSCLDDGDDYRGKNYLGNAAPAAWSSDTIADSFYLREVPDWWCQEACPFGQAGIGAFGDTVDSWETACKLPAQIRHEGGTCTPMGSQPASTPPSAPFLLD